MKLIKKRGYRIRASDKSMVFNFATSSLIVVFSMALLLLNVKQILNVNWENVRVIKNGTFHFIALLILCNVEMNFSNGG
ncbi:hypothetical protein ACLD43_08580 [Clostridium botulinum]|uniref:hypothetical protein n=1 Tax=Clostridium botulinum TaxID=1491 RepID=UPI003A7F7934